MAKTITAARSYKHKAFGEIGAVTFEAPEGEYRLNGKVLPAQSVDHLLTFALQTLQDAYAGAGGKDDAKARFDGKLERLIAGTLGARSGGGGVDAVTLALRKVLRPLVKDAMGDKWKDMEPAEQAKALDTIFAGQTADKQAALTAAAEDLIKREAAEAEARAKLKGGIALTI